MHLFCVCVFCWSLLTQSRCHFLSWGWPNPITSHTNTQTEQICAYQSFSHTLSALNLTVSSASAYLSNGVNYPLSSSWRIPQRSAHLRLVSLWPQASTATSMVMSHFIWLLCHRHEIWVIILHQKKPDAENQDINKQIIIVKILRRSLYHWRASHQNPSTPDSDYTSRETFLKGRLLLVVLFLSFFILWSCDDTVSCIAE